VEGVDEVRVAPRQDVDRDGVAGGERVGAEADLVPIAEPVSVGIRVAGVGAVRVHVGAVSEPVAIAVGAPARGDEDVRVPPDRISQVVVGLPHGHPVPAPSVAISG